MKIWVQLILQIMLTLFCFVMCLLESSRAGWVLGLNLDVSLNLYIKKLYKKKFF